MLHLSKFVPIRVPCYRTLACLGEEYATSNSVCCGDSLVTQQSVVAGSGLYACLGNTWVWEICNWKAQIGYTLITQNVINVLSRSGRLSISRHIQSLDIF